MTTTQDYVTSGRVLDAHETRNRDVALDYYGKLIGQWDFEAASEHLGDHFIQHNPTIPDGLEGVEGFARNVPPPVKEALRAKVGRVLVDGDMVVLHSLMTMPGTPDTVIVDMFRLENYKVVEHWDVIQQVPAEALHSNGMI